MEQLCNAGTVQVKLMDSFVNSVFYMPINYILKHIHISSLIFVIYRRDLLYQTF